MTRHLHLKLVYVRVRMCVCASPSFTSIYLVNIYEAISSALFYGLPWWLRWVQSLDQEDPLVTHFSILA